MPKANCLKLEKQRACPALALALLRTGKSIAARIAMMAITTSSSIRVNEGARPPARLPKPGFLSKLAGCIGKCRENLLRVMGNASRIWDDRRSIEFRLLAGHFERQRQRAEGPGARETLTAN